MAETKINNNQLNTPISLFDIKTNSEPITQKGWSCISYPTQNKLDKADVPTVYNVLKDKLDNAESGMSALTTMNNYTPKTCIDGWYYFIDNYKIYRSRYIDLSNAEFFYDGGLGSECPILSVIFANRNCLLTIKYSSYILTYILIDVNTKTLIKQTELSNNLSIYSYSNLQEAFQYNGYKATMLNNVGYVLACRASNGSQFSIISIKENGDVAEVLHFETNLGSVSDFFYKGFSGINISSGQGEFYKYITNICAFDNKLYFGTASIIFWYNPNDNTYDYNDVILSTGYTLYYNAYKDWGSKYFVYDNKLSVINTNGDGTQLYLYQLENNVLNLKKTIDISANPIFTAGYEYPMNAFWAFDISYDNYYYYFVFKGKNNTNIKLMYITNNFNNNSLATVYEFNGNITKLIINNNDFIYVCDSTYKYIYSEYQLTVYTDTINGIDIKYYKSGDWKICTPDIAVGNDTNLQDVYEYLGYLNYWWIDENNEQITLQRNSNMWTMMYVDDDYIDSSLPIGEYIRNKNLAEYIEISSTSITIANIQANKNYVLSNNAITDITFTACETSMEETTIQFTTGTNAPTLIDNSGLVWFDGIPTLLPNTTYVIVIFNKQAFYKEN